MDGQPLAFILKHSIDQLRTVGIDDPGLDARLLITHVLGCERVDLMIQKDRLLTRQEIDTINALIARRAAREPVARILGLREFWGLPFGLNEATLEPRPDSETLIETALKRVASPPARVLDLGTGTGCLLLALLHEWPQATGLGIDIAPRAVEQAQQNATRLGLSDRAAFRQGNWCETLTEHFDVIISNPPYIPHGDLTSLQPEVRGHDPMAALDGGADGLAPYRHLIPLLPSLLSRGGQVLFEVGISQATSVETLLKTHGFQAVEAVHDLGGVLRVVTGTCP